MKRLLLLSAVGSLLLVALVISGLRFFHSPPAPHPGAASIEERGIRVMPFTPAPPSSSGSEKNRRNPAPPASGTYALTFDDGPHPVNTPAILDWLAKNRIKATFFVLGENAKRYPALLKRIAAEGHEIGNHTWSHPELPKLKPAAVRAEIRRTHDLIRSLTGKAPVFFRPPFGALTAEQRKSIEKEFGYRTILWDADSFDWKPGTSDGVRRTLLSRVKPGSIILAHDIHSRILPALETLTPEWIRQGLQAAPLSAVLHRPAGKTPAMAAAGAR